MKNFISKYRFWINIFLGCAVFFCSLKIAELTFVLFSTIDKGADILVGINLTILFWWLFKLAYEIQDEAHYRRHFDKTGDDFEGRYKKD